MAPEYAINSIVVIEFIDIEDISNWDAKGPLSRDVTLTAVALIRYKGLAHRVLGA